MDIESLLEAFDKIDRCGWYVVSARDGEPAYFWIEGKFIGQEVFLRLLPNLDEAAEAGKDWAVWNKP